MSTCLEVLEPQSHPYIPPQSVSSTNASTLNPPERKQRAAGPRSCCCCPSGRGQGLGRRHRPSLQVEGQRDVGRTAELGAGIWVQGWQKKGSAKMLLEMSVSRPSLFWSAFIVMKVILSNIVWQRISEWTVAVLLILTAHFRAAGNAREMLILLS